MSFSFIWSPQTHKIFGGYYLNHDNLMIANPEDKKKLIFYFIGCQTPEKLNPIDRASFLKETKKIHNKAQISGVLAGVSFGICRRFSTKYNSRWFMNLGVSLIGFTFFYYLGYNVHYGISEPMFVNRNELVTNLSQKYDFSVFDFAQAKKESHLKELRKELTSESSNLLYS